MNSTTLNDFEIMAPVGSRESLAAAIQAGADSIYFGIENLNMRARSANTFTIDDLREIAQTCDEHGMKSYLTVNTIIYDNDISLMRTIVDAAKAAGISAVIAADVAVMSYARQIGQEVHLSTQLNISNVEALRFYAQFADVVVLARELNLEQVAEIYRHIREENICGPSGEQIRIEMFCHGALCMAVSGKCYLSLHEMNHSANRGACMQVCRRSYTVRDKETDVELEVDNQYIMSPKDLKTIHFMNKMLHEEIIPTLPLDKKDLEEFASAVEDRFNNPFVNHELMSISLNSTSKWKARNMPSFLAYIEEQKQLPKCLTMSLAAYIAFYSSDIQERTADGLICKRPAGNTYKIQDDAWALDFYYAHKDDTAAQLVNAVLTNTQMWDQDLTKIEGLEAAVLADLEMIRTQGAEAAYKSCL